MWEYLGSGMWRRIAKAEKTWSQEEVNAWHAALIKEIDEAVAKQQQKASA